MSVDYRLLNRRRTRRFRPARPALALALASFAGLTGCGREFFRNWADQDVTEAVFEKSRDPRWTIPLFSIEPPSMSRFADPYDPDRPPAPPDDPAAEALSPVPQWPHHRLLVPAEGTGYNDMLEAWSRDRPYQEEEENANDPGTPPPPPRPMEPPPGPTPDVMPPFGVDSPPIVPGADPAIMPPGTLDAPQDFPRSGENSGLPSLDLTPTPIDADAPRTLPSPDPSTTSGATRPQARTTPVDPGVQLSAFQTPPPDAPQRGTSPGTPPLAPGEVQDSPELSIEDALREEGRPIGDDPLLGRPMDPNDPSSVEVDLTQPAQAGAGLSSLLSPPPIPFSHTESAGLPEGSAYYVVTPVQALTLALINSRNYQGQIEAVYQAALGVTEARWDFTPQFYAGMSPTGNTAASFPNSFLYRTAESPGGQSSVLNLSTATGFSKALSFGGSVVAGFANQVIFNFSGANPIQPTVQSVMPIRYVQPFLAGGGRAVTLEPLTLAERQLLYTVRNFARFRQTFFPSILTSGIGTQGAAAGGVGFNPNTGYLQVLQTLQSVENTRKTVAVFASLLEGYREMAEGGGSGVSKLNVDQIALDLQSQRLNLVNQQIAYQDQLDQYKVQLGLPPDVPIVLDRELTQQFREVFDRIYAWYENEERDPLDLPLYVEELPQFTDVFIDGRPVVRLGIDPNYRSDVLLAAERVALENRYELMNARAQLYDAWRQLAVRANALKGIFNITVTNQVFTPAATTNPFAFSDQAKQFNLTMNSELPLARLPQRNVYRQGVILYRQQQRALMAQEDQIKFDVRSRVRTLLRLSEQYEIEQQRLVVSLQQKDNTQRQIFAPPGVGGGGSQQVTANTQALISAQNSLLNSQNNLIGQWVQYTTQRIQLYSDLGIIPYDEWEAYYELFPTESTRAGAGAAAGGPGSAAPPAPLEAAWAS